jgi:hypothetical protein
MTPARVPVPTPRITQDDEGVICLDYSWWPRVTLIPTAVRAILSVCARFDSRSVLAGQGGLHIRIDDESYGVQIQSRVSEIMADPANWASAERPTKFPKEVLVVRGSGDARGWDYSQQLGDTYYEP